MTRLPPRGLSADPLLQWTNLAVKTAEMMMASAQVISHRTIQIGGAGLSPSERDQAEFALMGQEKLDAATESAQAMASHLARMNGRLWTQASAQVLSGANAMLSMATNPGVDQSVEHHATWVRALSESAVNASQFAASAARLAHRGLKPIHAKATANAKRLGTR
jgi:hypothetical protein